MTLFSVLGALYGLPHQVSDDRVLVLFGKRGIKGILYLIGDGEMDGGHCAAPGIIARWGRLTRWKFVCHRVMKKIGTSVPVLFTKKEDSR